MSKVLLVGLAVYAAMLAIQILSGVTVKRREG
jgi:hypothetical protein